MDDLGPDCILLLEKEPRRPALRWDDLAVAYRNVRASAARPACTIDPRPAALKQLGEIGRKISSETDEQSIERSLLDWERVGRGPQDVRVFGVDPEKHFASVMVSADYELKSFCNGATSVPGLVSLTDRIANQARREIATGRGQSTPLDSQNRFWFNSGRVSYRTDGRLFVLKDCQVKLLTEEEAITHEGQRRGLARGEPMAAAFAEDLTKEFQALARSQAVFRELENLYRAVALANLIVAEGSSVSDLFDGLFSRINVEEFLFDETLPRRVMVKRIEGKVEGGTYRLLLPSCGGVSIDIHAKSIIR